jgi:phytol kinase
MLYQDLMNIGLYIGYIIAIGLPLVLICIYFHASFEVLRKMYHFVIMLSIFPLLKLFSTWYMAVLAAFVFVLIAYPILTLIENSSFYKRIGVERQRGEFKRSLIVVQVSFSLLIFVFWGMLGVEWQYVAVVGVMAWGFGDAAAALIGKKFGRRRFYHPYIEGAKTMEGTQAMFVVAGLAIFFTLMLYAGHPWPVSLASALLVAPICAIVELFSHRGMDTLTVPISTGLAVLSLMSLFSILGV